MHHDTEQFSHSKFLGLFRLFPLICCLLPAAFCLSCGSPEGFKKPEDALDAGREFVRAVLDGDYAKAELFVLPEAEDRQLFERFREHMKKRPENERLGLKSASIQINKVDELNDSVTVISYANSFEKHPADVRVVKHNGEWWVDFSYTFSGGALEDSLK